MKKIIVIVMLTLLIFINSVNGLETYSSLDVEQVDECIGEKDTVSVCITTDEQGTRKLSEGTGMIIIGLFMVVFGIVVTLFFL